MTPRRNGKSILPQLLKQLNKSQPKGKEAIGIFFDEANAICKHIGDFPVPIIKSGEIWNYSTNYIEEDLIK